MTASPQTPKPVTYADIWTYCCHPMGSISMLGFAIFRRSDLEGLETTPDIESALLAIKDCARDVIEHIQVKHGQVFDGICKAMPTTVLAGEELELYEAMIEAQYALQRLLGLRAGPVPVLI